jgi:hypothetical protein
MRAESNNSALFISQIILPEAQVQSLAVRQDSDTGSYLLSVAIIYAVINYSIRRKNAVNTHFHFMCAAK